MTKSNIIPKGTIIQFGYDFYSETRKITVIAKADINRSILESDIKAFMNNDVNSNKCCFNENCDGYDNLPVDYKLCPFCGKELEYEFNTPTIRQFIKYYHLRFEYAQIETFYTDFKD